MTRSQQIIDRLNAEFGLVVELDMPGEGFLYHHETNPQHQLELPCTLFADSRHDEVNALLCELEEITTGESDNFEVQEAAKPIVDPKSNAIAVLEGMRLMAHYIAGGWSDYSKLSLDEIRAQCAEIIDTWRLEEAPHYPSNYEALSFSGLTIEKRSETNAILLSSHGDFIGNVEAFGDVLAAVSHLVQRIDESPSAAMAVVNDLPQAMEDTRNAIAKAEKGGAE
jgi:hypothetical protein